jgi:hypothetical protein
LPYCFASSRHSSTKLRADGVDQRERSAGIGREAPAEDRADVGVAHVGEDAFLEAARRVEGLHVEEALLEVLDVGLVVSAGLTRSLQAGPKVLLAVLRVFVEALLRLLADAAELDDHLLDQLVGGVSSYLSPRSFFVCWRTW